MSPLELLNIFPPDWRPWVGGGFALFLLVGFYLKGTDKIEQGDLGMRSSAGALKLRYDTKRYTKEEIAKQKAVDIPLVLSGRPATYGRPKVWQPGLHLQMMMYHKYIKVTAQAQPYDIDDILITTEDGYRGLLFPQIKVHARVKDIYLWKLASKDSPAALRAVVNTELDKIMKLQGYAAAHEMSVEYQAAVEERLKEMVKPRFKELGFVFMKLELGMALEKTELTTGRSIQSVGDTLTVRQLLSSVSDAK